MGLSIYLEREPNPEELKRWLFATVHEDIGFLATDYLENNSYPNGQIIFSADYTHNLGAMAQAAGLYLVMWRPKETGIVRAKDAIDLLDKGLQKLIDNEEEYKRLYNPPNERGDYHGFKKIVNDYLKACIEYPESLIRVLR